MSEQATATPRTATAAEHARIRIGISGWRYAGWRRRFYPPGLRQADELSYAARHFNTVEINGTHYSLQRPEFFARWHDETPGDFVFAVKGSRFITHMKQLTDIETRSPISSRRRRLTAGQPASAPGVPDRNQATPS